jgi:hypothetical protein
MPAEGTMDAIKAGVPRYDGNVLAQVTPIPDRPWPRPPGAGSATCDVGVYGAVNGQPNTLIVDGGTLSGTGTLVTAGTFSTPVQLAPQTLYFLAVGCSGPASLIGALDNTGAPSAPLTGAFDYTDTTTQMTAPWPFVANALPTLFGNGTITSAAGSIPNVYAGPRALVR